MNRRGFVITFSARESDDAGVDRVRNWAEDLFRHTTRKGWGEVEDPNRSTDKVWVVAATPRATADLAKAIERSLRRHNLHERAVVTKLTGPGSWAEYETFVAVLRNDRMHLTAPARVRRRRLIRFRWTLEHGRGEHEKDTRRSWSC